MANDILIMMPAYNEEQTVGDVIKDLLAIGFTDILVVDDGSKDKTKHIAQKAGARVVNHPINIGVGGALSTGFEYARQNRYNFLICMDSDGQHKVEDVTKLSQALKDTGIDIVNGSRLNDLRVQKPSRYYVNRFSNILTYILGGTYITDSQSGLRGFNRKAIECIDITTSGYEANSEIIIKAARNNLKIKEIPISAIYTEYSLRKGQKISNALRVVGKLLLLN